MQEQNREMGGGGETVERALVFQPVMTHTYIHSQHTHFHTHMHCLRHAPKATAELCRADRQAAGGEAAPSLHCSPLGLSAFLLPLGFLVEGWLCSSTVQLI